MHNYLMTWLTTVTVLSKIAFQYYPLDQNPQSNPFIVSWWPLALNDPGLFNVSLQTASLDDERLAQKGFPHSEILMSDCVQLIRHKVQDPVLAFGDSTLAAVVTLAAIEVTYNSFLSKIGTNFKKHGKENYEVSSMHINGVRRMVNVRGGIQEVKKTSPITARMVPWQENLL